MTFGEGPLFASGKSPEERRKVCRFEGVAQDFRMADGAGAVCNHSRDPEFRIPVRKAGDERGDASRHALRIHHKNDRNAECERDFGGGAFERAGGDSVEQPHYAFDDGGLRRCGEFLPVQPDTFFARHAAVEIDRLRARRAAVERGVDVVGPAFERRDAQTAPSESAHERERKRRLAAARIHSGDEKAGKVIAGIRHISPDSPVTYTFFRSARRCANIRELQ